MHAEQKPILFEHQHAAPASTVSSFVIFLILGGLTFMALLIGFSDLGNMKLYFSLGVAVAQAVVLGLFSMELKNQSTLIWLTVASSVFWTFLLFLFTLTDFITRGWASY
jgi:caa(3)-type oxidase subunit IV